MRLAREFSRWKQDFAAGSRGSCIENIFDTELTWPMPLEGLGIGYWIG